MGAGADLDGGGWSVYLVRCMDGALYTGIARDVERRLAEHREGRGAKALRGRGPLVLVLAREVGERGHALRVEAAIKRLKKGDKEVLARRARLVEGLIKAAAR
jgi:putative endonuclease